MEDKLNEAISLKRQYQWAISHYYAEKYGIEFEVLDDTVEQLHDDYFGYWLDWGAIAEWVAKDYHSMATDDFADYDEESRKCYKEELEHYWDNIDAIADRLQEVVEI